MKKSSSYILIFVLLVLSFLSFVVSKLTQQTNVYLFFTKTVYLQENAKLLALSGITMARAELGEAYLPINEKNEQEQQNKDSKEQKQAKNLLKKILPVLNRWQIFKLTEKEDGVDGEIKVCIFSEDGKINLNKWFDFQKKEFKPDMANIIKLMTVGSNIKGEKILKDLTDFFKRKNKPIEDLSELLEIDSLKSINLMYSPLQRVEKTASGKEDSTIYLQDFFTVYSESEKVEPWLFSHSLDVLFGVRLPKPNDASVMKENFVKAIDKFKLDLGSNWDVNWGALIPIYEKKPAAFQVLGKLLSQQFAPSVYTVISCGKIGNVEQKLLAVLVKQNPKTSSTNKGSGSHKEEQENLAQYFKVIKVIWL
ncbi:MAG: hypothetical protein UR14_C0006G0047 [candidate division TM6 bacterium GW2011_GWE2_31_21]|nr:MAG: hypothetical protein UR14_C0006G0047 [candidate division TM6 bacterium GW2011_GWE2_31_21]KKP53530.1 MAG: hypothetical protein UR43_C0004G0071 [candidate division TM6 bacterium GW2011_GWF2_33_332]